MKTLYAYTLGLALSAAACGGDAVPVTTERGIPGSENAPAPRPRGGAAGGAAGTAAGETAEADAGRPPPLQLADNDFSESDRVRDPFRSFAREFIPVRQGPTINESEIKLRNFALEELRLVAVVAGVAAPYAMVTEAGGRGTIIRRGDYVGRPDTIAGGADGVGAHQVPWRVARILSGRVRRDAENNLVEIPGEVVFEREDRLNPNATRAERSITLNPQEAASNSDDSNAVPTTPLPSNGGNGSPFLPTLSAPVPGGATAPTMPPGMRAPRGVPGVAGIPSIPTGVQTVPIGPGGAATVQTYTQVIPPQPAQAGTTTLVIQTGPQGQTAVGRPSGAAAPAPAPTPVPSVPQGPPPVQITGGGALPTSGLSP